ncbi:MAG TPA: flagellar hook capping protein [Clostridiales bacterium]|nr:flagellar hook capping protein [Clostridiales bacterium]
MSNSVERSMGAPRVINAVFTDKTDNSVLETSDFIRLMVAQMQNQDFYNPADTSDMLNQIATISNMQRMQEMASYSKMSYAMSLVGKVVTASRFNVSGNLETTTGVVEKLSLVNNEYVFYIGDKKYTLQQIMEVSTGSEESTEEGSAGTE